MVGIAGYDKVQLKVVNYSSQKPGRVVCAAAKEERVLAKNAKMRTTTGKFEFFASFPVNSISRGTVVCFTDKRET